MAIQSLDLFSFLGENGGANNNANGDYSSLGVNFFFECPSEIYGRQIEYAEISRAVIHYEDAGNFDADKYGNNITITNGIEVRQEKRGYTIDMTAGRPIKTNAQWEEMTGDTHHSTYGTGNDFLTVTWNFEDLSRELRLFPGEKLVFFFNDDFSGLIEQIIKVQGHYEYKNN